MVLPDSSRISRVPPYSGTKHTETKIFQVRDFHPLWSPFPVAFPYISVFSKLRERSSALSCSALQPHRCNGAALHNGSLGSSHFARRYSGNLIRFLFLQVLRWFSSLGVASYAYFIQRMMTGIHTRRVTPFGNPRIKGCLLLPEAYRSLPRPSSPDGSKASTVDPYSLDHIISNPFPNTCQRTLARNIVAAPVQNRFGLRATGSHTTGPGEPHDVSSAARPPKHRGAFRSGPD